MWKHLAGRANLTWSLGTTNKVFFCGVSWMNAIEAHQMLLASNMGLYGIVSIVFTLSHSCGRWKANHMILIISSCVGR